MYFDSKPCTVCGSPVDLRPRDAPEEGEAGRPVGAADGVVGGADPTVDERVCSNPDCPSHRDDGPEA